MKDYKQKAVETNLVKSNKNILKVKKLDNPETEKEMLKTGDKNQTPMKVRIQQVRKTMGHRNRR